MPIAIEWGGTASGGAFVFPAPVTANTLPVNKTTTHREIHGKRNRLFVGRLIKM
jgi:hypothetical protein